MPIIKEDPLRRYDPADFSFESVKGEVSEAMHFDWKRDKVDDAKKRAIYDSGSYDIFKDRVAGCTLKPIHRNEFNAPPKFTFNGNITEKPAVAPYVQDAAKPSSVSKISGRGRGGELPKNGHEFERELRRRATAEDKVRLLQVVLDSDGSVAKLFGRELDGEMLRQVLTALEEVLVKGTAAKGTARRFLMAVALDCPVSITAACSFFDAEERATLARLLARDPAAEPGEDVRVCAAFGIPVASVAEAAAKLSADLLEEAAAIAEEPPAEVPQVAEAAGCDGMD